MVNFYVMVRTGISERVPEGFVKTGNNEKKILINARHPVEKRVAIVQGELLVDFYVEVPLKEHLKGNIYKAAVARVEPSLHAAFVDFGPKRHGFLQYDEVMPSVRKAGAGGKGRIQDALGKGQELIVQVEREERDTKGARLTTYISLPGRYVVMMPGQEKVRVSRKIESRAERERLKELFQSLKLPGDAGFILRTAGMERSTEELAHDLKYLTKLWNKIQAEAKKASAPALVYKEEDIAVRTVRDYLTTDVAEVIVDEKETARAVRAFLRRTMPWRKINVTYYKAARPLFDIYGLEVQIAKLGERFVSLPSRGYLVLDKTEALTAIDVNSGRSRKEKGVEQTALKTNLEAADEIARQLRLRDIGGLIVIDFIDMEQVKHRREVEARLSTALHEDKAKWDLGRISQFGMLEMTRERLRSTYFETTTRACPVCAGAGVLKADELVALSAFREMHTRASEGGIEGFICRLPVASANFLMNEMRQDLVALEKEFKVRVSVLADGTLPPGQVQVQAQKEAGEAPAEEQETPEAPRKKKRPRRRGRKKPAGKEAAEAPGEEEAVTVQEKAAGEEAAPETPEEAQGEAAPEGPRKKRRPRRRGRKKAAQLPKGEGETAAEAPAEPSGEEAPVAEAAGAPAEAATGGARKRRRPRRRGPRKKAPEEKPEASESVQAAGEGAAEG
jgi:ribonuclease E